VARPAVQGAGRNVSDASSEDSRACSMYTFCCAAEARLAPPLSASSSGSCVDRRSPVNMKQCDENMLPI